MRHPVPSGEERARAGNSAPDHVPNGMLDFARAFPEAVNVLAGYFLPVGHAIHLIAAAPAVDLRGWFARQAEDLGRLAGAYLEAVRDGRVDAEEALDLLALSAALRGRVDALEAALREGAVA